MAEETVHEIPVEVNGFDEAFRTDEFIFMRPIEPISGLYSEEQLATLNETSLSENEVSNFTCESQIELGLLVTSANYFMIDSFFG